MTILDAIHERSRQQHGLVLVEDLSELGLDREAVRHLVRSCRLERVTRRVLRVPGAPVTPRQHVLVGVLDASPNAFAAETTGASLWGVAGHRLAPVHVACGDGGSSRRSRTAIVHRIAGLLQEHVTMLDGIPILRPEVVVLQLCGSDRRERAASALDNMWRRRLTSGPALRRTLDQLAGSGRRGVVVLRELLDERGDGYIPPASGLEGRVDTILRRAGLPPLRRQVDVGDERWIGRVDFRDPHCPLILEVQSETYHSALVDKRHDERRLAALRAAGFEVVEVTDAQVWHRPHEVVAAVRSARERLRRSV
jgi:very-short-patch-repair endonuclease